jgi:propionate CoA-transferase
MKDKVVSAAEAMALVRPGDTVCCSGFVGIGTPDELLVALEKRFIDTTSPVDLTLVFAAAPGDGAERGLNRLAHPGLVKRAIGGHWSLVPKLGRMATEGLIEAYNLPLGTIAHLYRDIAAKRAGTLTKVGLGTFVDPRQGGGRINDRTTEQLVQLMQLDGEDWLLYGAFPIHVALIRATTADPSGNLTMEREALTLDSLAVAMAARNSGGLVVAQVERIAARGSLDPRAVQVPGILVDCIVVAAPAHHLQTYATPYSPAYSSEIQVPANAIVRAPLDERKLIARRCAFELPLGGVINLGIGVPEVVAAVAAEERILRHVTLTAEPGVIGGMPQGGLDFGAAVNTEAMIAQSQQFDFYDGGGLDLACLGMAEVDRFGNVNVSRFGSKLAGAGGFINISQNAKRLVFAGTFTAGGLVVEIEDGQLRIAREGKVRKFVESVEQITFDGPGACARGQPVLYVTERCVFRLDAEGLELIEVAPGIDIDRDILAQMAFKPIIRDPKAMSESLFRRGPMNLAALLQDMQLSDRLSYDAARNTLFANFEGLVVNTPADIESIRRVFESRCEGIGQRVALIVNYDAFRVDEALAERYLEMVAELQQRFYASATRYTTSAFMRAKLGSALAARDFAPHVFETRTEALGFARTHGGPAP